MRTGITVEIRPDYLLQRKGLPEEGNAILHDQANKSQEIGMRLRNLRAPALSRWLLLFFGLGLLTQGAARAEDQSVSLPAVFTKAVPESPKDLRAIELHVKSLLKKTMPATVGLIIG